MSREDLALFERESSPPANSRAAEPSGISEVKQASGSRPRVDRPPSSARGQAPAASEDGSAPKSVSTSAVSSLAVPRTISEPAPARSGTNGIIIGAIAACVAGGALAFLVFSRVGPKEAATAAAPGEPSAPSASASAGSTPRSVAPTETVSVEDLPIAPDGGDVQRAAGGHFFRRSGVRPPPKAKEKEPAQPNCNPPYVIDGDGIKRLKPGCL